ncbi:MAG: hypothetical protein AB7U76_21200 [Pirellulales bacterium]
MSSADSELTGLNLKQLELAVRIAALPAAEQIARLKGWAVADEIALDFDNWCRWALEGAGAPELTNEQRASLIALDHRFDQMSGEHNAELWTDHALRSRPEWAEVRRDAQTILRQMGWTDD